MILHSEELESLSLDSRAYSRGLWQELRDATTAEDGLVGHPRRGALLQSRWLLGDGGGGGGGAGLSRASRALPR